MFWKLTAAAGLVGMSLAAQAEMLTIVHSQGQTQVQKQPKTVAVLDWSTLDTMAALGVEAQGIPSVNVLPPMLEQYGEARFVAIGTLFEPDLEAIKELDPDLIILGRRAAKHYEEVSQYAPTLDLTPNPTDMLSSVVHHTELLGQIFDKSQQAAELTEKLKSSVQDLKAASADQGTGLMMLTTNGKMVAMGEGSRFGMVYDVFGMESAITEWEEGKPSQAVSYEQLTQVNPDWIFVMDRDAAIGKEAGAQKLMDNVALLSTAAGANEQIVYVDPVGWYLLDNSGVRVMQESVDALLQVFAKN